MSRRAYRNDPHTITVRYSSTCSGCGKPINRGDRAYYYPLGRELYGEVCGCAAPHERDFESAAFDEEVLSSGW